MKIRCDYITNSSSSNFILVFKDKKEYQRFIDDAEFCNYVEFADLIQSIADNNESLDKNTAVERLYRYYRFEKVDGLKLEKEIADKRGKDTWEINFDNDEEYQYEISKRISKTDFKEKKELIMKSEIVINGTVWDTYGGLLEWAIRNGFIEQSFRKYCLMVWNIG